MNYSKIEDLRNSKRFSKTEIAGRLGMTLNGYEKMISLKTLNVERLEKLCEIFKVPINYFFDDNEKIQEVNEAAGEYSTRNKELSEQLLASKDEQIRLLQEQVDLLKKLSNK